MLSDFLYKLVRDSCKAYRYIVNDTEQLLEFLILSQVRNQSKRNVVVGTVYWGEIGLSSLNLTQLASTTGTNRRLMTQ